MLCFIYAQRSCLLSYITHVMRQAEWGCIDWGWLCTHPHAATRAAPSTGPRLLYSSLALSPLALVHWLSFNGPPFWLRQGPIPFPCIRYFHYKLISLVIVWLSLIGYPSSVTPLNYDVTAWPLLEHPDLEDLHRCVSISW